MRNLLNLDPDAAAEHLSRLRAGSHLETGKLPSPPPRFSCAGSPVSTKVCSSPEGQFPQPHARYGSGE